MTRDPALLSASTFDLLVVGGGICGLTIAYDASQRGLHVALIERDDFGSGNSFNHLRTIHGGLRYLQKLDLARSRESIVERRTLARIAPHALQRQLFALPLYRSVMRGRLALRAGLLLDSLVSFDRNQDVPAALGLPAGRVVPKAEAIDRFPGFRRQGLTGAATWYDYVTTEADRLTLSWALAAFNNGATLANHVDATAPLLDGRRVIGIRAIDRLSGRTVDISARLTINATGAALDQLLTPLGLTARFSLLKAMNLVTTREAGGEALGGLSASGRPFFLVPWHGRAIFGTWESKRFATPTERRATNDDVTQFIGELNHAFPALELQPSDVSLVHRGLVPAASGADGSVVLLGHAQTRDHVEDGVEGLMSVAGAKYTTARAVAERVTDTAVRKLGRKTPACRTSVTPLPGGDVADVSVSISQARSDYRTRVPDAAIPHLIAVYGSRFREVLDATAHCRAWLTQLSPESPVLGAELIWATRHEMAMTLPDAVIRRTPLGALGHPGESAARGAAALMAQECGWSSEHTTAELAALDRFYQL